MPLWQNYSLGKKTCDSRTLTNIVKADAENKLRSVSVFNHSRARNTTAAERAAVCWEIVCGEGITVTRKLL